MVLDDERPLEMAIVHDPLQIHVMVILLGDPYFLNVRFSLVHKDRNGLIAIFSLIEFSLVIEF